MDLNFSRGTKVRVIGGAYNRMTGVIDSHMFGASFDHPDEGAALGYGVVLDDGDLVFVRHDQVRLTFRKSADRLEG